MCYRFLFCFFAFAMLVLTSSAQNTQPTLSERAEISILTCSPGDELYSTFGHTAIRLTDPVLRIDSVYNYGTFEFTDGFYVKFARGKLDYKLSKSSFREFMNEYIYFGRAVEEQVLLLSRKQKQQLFDALEVNFLPENREYRYDFFFDNCSTRVRDMIEDAVGGEVNYPEPMPEKTMTFREMIESYQGHMPWGDFGIDLALGVPCDAYMKHPEQMFIPDYLRDQFATATLDGKPLCSPVKELIPVRVEHDTPPFDWPYFISILLLLLTLARALFVVTTQRESLYWDQFILFLFGLIGLVVALLWFATDHTITKVNLNVIWAFPFHLCASFLVKKIWMKKYFMFFTIVLFAFLVSESWWPQDFHHTFWPLAGTLFITCIRMATLPPVHTNQSLVS